MTHTCPHCGVIVRPQTWADGEIGVTHDEPLCEWFRRTATTAELDELARQVHNGPETPSA